MSAGPQSLPPRPATAAQAAAGAAWPLPLPPHVVLPEIPEEKPFAERLMSLLRVDCIRFSRILETMQYATLYACICMPVGILIDRACGPLYPKMEDEGEPYTWNQTWQAVAAAILQVVLSAVSIIYIRKLADLVPFLFNFCPSRYVAHYHVDEVFGEAAIALIFVGVQTSLIKALDKIRARVGGAAEAKRLPYDETRREDAISKKSR